MFHYNIVFNIKLRTSRTLCISLYIYMVDPIISENWEMKKIAEQITKNWTAKRPATYMAWFTFQVCPSWLSPPRAKNIVICTETKPANLDLWQGGTFKLQTLEFGGQCLQEGCNLSPFIAFILPFLQITCDGATTSHDNNKPWMTCSEYFRTKPPRIWQCCSKQCWPQNNNLGLKIQSGPVDAKISVDLFLIVHPSTFDLFPRFWDC